MSSLYLLPYNVLIGVILVLTVTALAQTFCTIYGFFTFRYLRKHLWRSLWEASVLCELMLQLVYTAEAVNQIRDGFFIPCPYVPVRMALLLVTTVLSIGVAVTESDFLPISVPAVTAMTLPAAERIAGKSFPIILFFAMGFWLFRAVNHLLIYRRRRLDSLSAFSVKEAVDTMDFGILFCRADGISDGQILLSNRKMQELIYTMTGRRICSGKLFYKLLISGQVSGDCRKDAFAPLPVYHFPDGTVWRFDLLSTWVRGIKCVILIASDTTEYMQATDELRRQELALKQRNLELKAMLQNLEHTCRAEETLRAKTRVHDLLGQQISLILRSVREHREPDEALLQAFANGLPLDLQNATGDCGHSLHSVARSFKNLGVSVDIQGPLPEKPDVQKAFYEIATEAMTNAVHHGYATEIVISFSRSDGAWGLHIRDNGTVREGSISEGGGLREMRRKISELGGSFSYTAAPHFTISISVPEGG